MTASSPQDDYAAARNAALSHLLPYERAILAGDGVTLQTLIDTPGFDPRRGDPERCIETARNTLGEAACQRMQPAIESLLVLRQMVDQGLIAPGQQAPYRPHTFAQLDRAQSLLDHLSRGQPPATLATPAATTPAAPSPEAPVNLPPATSAALERARQFAQSLSASRTGQPAALPSGNPAPAIAYDARTMEALERYQQLRQKLKSQMASRSPAPAPEAAAGPESSPAARPSASLAQTAPTEASIAPDAARHTSQATSLLQAAQAPLERFLTALGSLKPHQAGMVPATLGVATILGGASMEAWQQAQLSSEALQAYRGMVSQVNPSDLLSFVRAGLSGELASFGGNTIVRGAAVTATAPIVGGLLGFIQHLRSGRPPLDEAHADPNAEPEMHPADGPDSRSMHP